MKGTFPSITLAITSTHCIDIYWPHYFSAVSQHSGDLNRSETPSLLFSLGVSVFSNGLTFHILGLVCLRGSMWFYFWNATLETYEYPNLHLYTLDGHSD